MDLFEEYLQTKETSEWVKRALTDKSYKNANQYGGSVNTDLATYGDAVIKLCYLELLLDNSKKLSEEKAKFESDKFLVEKVAKHYQLIEHISKDLQDENLPNDYDYECTPGENKNRHKYIATAVEAMVGAIYKETKDLKPIIELLDSWRKL